MFYGDKSTLFTNCIIFLHFSKLGQKGYGYKNNTSNLKYFIHTLCQVNDGVNFLLDTTCEMLICYTNTLQYLHRLQASQSKLKLWHILFDEALAITAEN